MSSCTVRLCRMPMKSAPELFSPSNPPASVPRLDPALLLDAASKAMPAPALAWSGGILVRAGVGGSLRGIGRQSGRIVFFACHQKIFLNHDVPTALQSLLSLGRETYFQNRRNIVLRAMEEQRKT